MPAGPEAKESPGFFDLMAFFRSTNIFCPVVQCWQSNAKAKLWQVRSVTNSKTNVKEHACTSTEDRSHTKLRREDLARSILPWRRAPDQRQRSAGRYIYIYRDRKPSQHVTVGLAWGSPQLYSTPPSSQKEAIVKGGRGGGGWKGGYFKHGRWGEGSSKREQEGKRNCYTELKLRVC